MKTANATLDDLLSPADQELLAQCLASVVEHGFGEVHLVIEQGMVKFIRPEFSYSTTIRENDKKALEAE